MIAGEGLVGIALAVLAVIPACIKDFHGNIIFAIVDANGNIPKLGELIDISGKFSTGNIGGLVFFALLIGAFVLFIYKKNKPAIQVAETCGTEETVEDNISEEAIEE